MVDHLDELRWRIIASLVALGVAFVLCFWQSDLILDLAANPLPILLMVVQIATRTGEFALAKPARETIYTRVDAETRYKAKAFIDTAIYRGGDFTFAWVHKAIASFGSAVVFMVGTGMAMALVLSAWTIVRAQRTLSR